MPSPLSRYYSRRWLLPSLLALLVSLAPVPGVRAETPTVELSKGDLPLLIVAGHGGKLPLEGAEQRAKDKVDDPHFVLFGDSETNELATDLAGAVAQEYGAKHRPSLITNQIHRRYADVNRKPELTSHDPLGVAHSQAFHTVIDSELERLIALHGWALLLDIHGQARYETALLLGTGNSSQLSPWTVESLWGRGGLVPSLVKAGFTVEPGSPEGKQAYGGGFTVRHHGADPRVLAWQMEHSSALRGDPEARSLYLEALANSLFRCLKSPPSATFKSEG